MKLNKYAEAFDSRPLFLPVFIIASIPKTQADFALQHGLQVGAQVVGLSDNGFFIKTVNGRPAMKFQFNVANVDFVKHDSFNRSQWEEWLEHRNEAPAPEEKKANSRPPKAAKAPAPIKEKKSPAKAKAAPKATKAKKAPKTNGKK
jgi:hypothetical protein